MKVFISWSGDSSREIGEVFRNWLPDVLQFVQPYFTPNDIEKGQRWSSDIAANLEMSKFGLICITAENLLAPWLMFEAGAISKSATTARVCPLLFGVETSQLTGPLLQFQATPFSKDEVLKFISAVNTAGESVALSESQLLRAFDQWWPDLEEKIRLILAKSSENTKTPPRSMQDMIEETLNVVRALSGPHEAEEPLHHWLLFFENLVDYASDSVKISSGADQFAQLEQLKRLSIFLRGAFNLIAPKLTKFKAYQPLATKAAAGMKDIQVRIKEIEAVINDDDIPF